MNTNEQGLLPDNQPQEIQQDMGQEQVLAGEDTGNSEMYKKTIEALMDKVQSKYGELNSIKFSTDNQNAAQKNDILKTIFDAMKQAGIDPSNPEEINNFMAKLEQESPDLFELFNEAMDSLLGPDQNGAQDVNTQQPETTGLSLPENNMDMNQQPQESLQPQSPADPTLSPM